MSDGVSGYDPKWFDSVDAGALLVAPDVALMWHPAKDKTAEGGNTPVALRIHERGGQFTFRWQGDPYDGDYPNKSPGAGKDRPRGIVTFVSAMPRPGQVLRVKWKENAGTDEAPRRAICLEFVDGEGLYPPTRRTDPEVL